MHTEVGPGFRLLVCGDRNWGRDVHDRYLLEHELATWAALYPDLIIIEGEAKGADTMAREWAEQRGVLFEPYPAEWIRFGRAAGPIRNLRMLTQGKPDYVVAFHRNLEASRGTKHMVGIARKSGIPVRVVS